MLLCLFDACQVRDTSFRRKHVCLAEPLPHQVIAICQLGHESKSWHLEIFCSCNQVQPSTNASILVIFGYTYTNWPCFRHIFSIPWRQEKLHREVAARHAETQAFVDEILLQTKSSTLDGPKSQNLLSAGFGCSRCNTENSRM